MRWIDIPDPQKVVVMESDDLAGFKYGVYLNFVSEEAWFRDEKFNLRDETEVQRLALTLEEAGLTRVRLLVLQTIEEHKTMSP